MNISKTLVLLLVTTLLVSTSAPQAQTPARTLVTPSNVKVYFYGQLRSYHVTELTASNSTCDSPDTYSFMVSWKPVFRDWNLPPGAGPYIWKHYLASNQTRCQQSIIMCGDPVCTMKLSSCPVTVAYGLVRIQTYFDETETGRSSWVQIGGIARPTLTYDPGSLKWKCLGGGGL